MRDLTTLEVKLAEVLGLTQATRETLEKVEGLVDDESAMNTLKQMLEQAGETERRCIELADGRNGKRAAILERAQKTKGEAAEMMSAYLGNGQDGHEGFELVTTVEGGEVRNAVPDPSPVRAVAKPS